MHDPRVVTLALCFAIAGLFGCSRGECEACGKDADCATGFACDGKLSVCKRPGRTMCETECASARDCAELGLCHSVSGSCAATTGEDCRGSAVCRSEGRCTQQSGQCVVASDDDCKNSAFCTTDGRCHHEAGRCVVASDADCKGAAVCTTDGRCRVVEGRCVVSTEGCRALANCKTAGHCSAVGDRCAASDDADCKQSRRCATHGDCKAQSGQCVASSNDDCSHALACTQHGACTAEAGICTGETWLTLRGEPNDCRSFSQCCDALMNGSGRGDHRDNLNACQAAWRTLKGRVGGEDCGAAKARILARAQRPLPDACL